MTSSQEHALIGNTAKMQKMYVLLKSLLICNNLTTIRLSQNKVKKQFITEESQVALKWGVYWYIPIN